MQRYCYILIVFTAGLTSIIFSINYDCEMLNHIVGTHSPPEVIHLPAVEESSAAGKYDITMTSCVNYHVRSNF